MPTTEGPSGFKDPNPPPVHLQPGVEYVMPRTGHRLTVQSDGTLDINHGQLIGPSGPLLGYATTRELAEELAARMRVGGEDPDYRTVDGDVAEGRRRAHESREDVMGWAMNPPVNIREAVGMAVGAASTCFENDVPWGVMDERRASSIVDALLDQIEKYKIEKYTQRIVDVIGRLSVDEGGR